MCLCVCASCMLDPQHPCRHVNMTIAVFPSVHLLMLFFSFAFFSPHACIYFYLFVVFCVDQRLPRHADADTLQSLIVIVAIWCGQINCNAFYFPIPGFNLPPDAPLNKVRRISMEYIYICTICTYIPPFCRRYQTQIGFNGAVSNCRKKNGFFSFACAKFFFLVFRSSVQFVAGMKMMALECRINAHLHGEWKVDIVMIVLCCVLSFRKILLSIHRNACDRNCDVLIEDF